MSFIQVTLGLIDQVQPPVLPVSKVKTEVLMEIKNEPPESDIVEIGMDNITSSLEEETTPDLKHIDIVLHPLCEGLIKSETVPEDLLETKHLESVETQVYVKTENSPFLKRENKTEDTSEGNGSWGTGQGIVEAQGHHNVTVAPVTCPKGSSPNGISTQVFIKTEDTRDENVIRGTGQEVIEVQGSNEYSNTLSNLETHKQLALNSSKDLNGIGSRISKSKHAKKTDFGRCYKTDGTTSWKKEKIKVIKVPVIPVEAHEYTSLTEDKYVCNHCQHACNKLKNLKLHIRKIHREVTTMYQCPYCSYKSKWSVREHIIQKHKDTKDIQWFQCNLCEIKFKLRSKLTQHMKVHLKHKQMKDGLDLREKSYHCNNCGYKTDNHIYLKKHKLVHLKPEEIAYFYCYHCSYKFKQKSALKIHIFRHHFKNVRYGCNKCKYETYTSTQLKSHKLTHLKPEEVQYFYCYHCSYKTRWKGNLKGHIFTHFKK